MGRMPLLSYPRVHVAAPRDNNLSMCCRVVVKWQRGRQGRKVGMPAHKTKSGPVSSVRVGGMKELEISQSGRRFVVAERVGVISRIAPGLLYRLSLVSGLCEGVLWARGLWGAVGGGCLHRWGVHGWL